MDYFYEQLQKSEKTSLYKLLNVLAYVFLCVGIFIFAGSISTAKYAIALVVISVIIFLIKRAMLVEYEYIFTNGELEIDIIYEMKRRRKAVLFDMKDIEIMARENSDYIKNFNNIPKKQKKLYNKNEENIFSIVLSTEKSGRMLINFTPDNTLLDMCYRFNPRNVKKN